MLLEFDGLFDMLTDAIDLLGGGVDNAVVDPAEGAAAAALTDSGHQLGALAPPWGATPNLNYMDDWDGDGIPNYADHWFGPGASSPFGALQAAPDAEFDPAMSDGGALEPGNHRPWDQSDVGLPAEHVGDHAPAQLDGLEGLAEAAESPVEQHSYGEAALDGWHLGLQADAVTVAGVPEADGSHWAMQEGANSCAVASQRGVLEAVTGMCLPEEELARIAESRGWYDPVSGTDPSAVGNLLEAFGVPADRKYETTFTELYDALARGEKVIVGLDANEIWTPQVGPDGHPMEQPDAGHAVWVTGIQMREDGGLNVVMNDSGRPDGGSVEVPVEDFRNAWADYGNFSVTTRLHEGPVNV